MTADKQQPRRNFQDYSRVRYGIYTDPDVYVHEQDKIFRGEVWCFVGMEAEIPNPGDFKTTFVGDTPVIVLRNDAGTINVLVNRCVHRGNLVCTKENGNAPYLTCLYHNWTYTLDGALRGVAFQGGTDGKGGMPADFQKSEHRLRKLRVETFCGIIFCSFSETVADLKSYLGPDMRDNMERVIGRPMTLLGFYSQYLPNNWKLYMENVRDSYHASLLHLFQATFRLNRLSMKGGIRLSDNGWHHVSYSIAASDREEEEYSAGKLRAVDDDYALQDPTLMQGWPEFACGTTLAIQTIYPNLVIQQISNSLALRLCLPKGPEECELLWWVLGTQEDTEAQTTARIKQSNMVGPGGLISLEDGVVGGWVQRASQRDPDDQTFIIMGGHDVAPSEEGRATEVAIRGFWKGYRELTGL